MTRPASPVLAGALLALASLASCRAFDHPRNVSMDPDERLATILQAIEAQQAGEEDGIVAEEGPQVLSDHGYLLNELEKLANEFPRHVPTLLANGLFAFEARAWTKAERFLDNVLLYDPRNAEATVMRARIAAEAGNLAFAQRLLSEQVRHRPDSASLREAYSGILFYAKELDQAAVQLDVAERLGAPSWRVAFNRGLIAETQGRINEALQFYGQAMQENPSFSPPRWRWDGLNASRTTIADPLGTP